MNKKFVKPLAVLAVGCALVVGSSVGATRAAIIYQDAAKQVDFDTANVSVDVYEGTSSDDAKVISDTLSLPGIGDDVNIGQKYNEYVSVVNSSTKYSEYVRVKVRKYWVNEKNGVLEKNTSLDPALIKLDIDESVWFKNPNESTEEEDVYYYCNPLSKAVEGESSNSLPFITGVTIDNQITTEVVLEGGTKDENGSITGNVTNKYIYDNASFYIEIEADAVQSHNAEAAIYGAWGVHATSTAEDDGTLTSIDGNATGR